MNKIWRYMAILILLASNAAAFDIRIEGEKITLRATGEPLGNILKRMSQLGIKVRVDPRLNPDITADFENHDAREVIEAIVRPYDHVLIWKKMPQNPSSFRLTEIQVFMPGRQDLMRDVEPRAFSLAKDRKSGAVFVRDKLLVRAKSGTDIEKLVKKIGGTIIGKNKALGIFEIRLPPDSDVAAIADKLDSLPGIVRAEPDFAYSVPRSHHSDSALSSAEIPKVFRDDGKVPVAVLDSGLMPGVGPEGFVTASLDAVNPGQPLSDNVGHGTQMALIASGLIKPLGTKADDGGQVPVIAIRAMDDNGFTTDATIMKSIDFALEKGARVLSLSWGSEKQSDFLKNIMDYAASKGMIVVASAGNEPTGNPVYPAAYPSVIGVGAVYPDGRAWEKSNYGSSADLSAPGFAVFPVGSNGGAPGIYAGTSVSAAFAANRIADYLSKNPKSSSGEIRENINQILSDNRSSSSK